MQISRLGVHGVFEKKHHTNKHVANVFIVSISSVWLICARLGHERWQVVFFVCLQTGLIGALASIGVDDKAKAIALIFVLACSTNQPLYMLFTMTTLNLEDQTDM